MNIQKSQLNKSTSQQLVSVIICTKDRPETLNNVIPSILNQSYKNLEIIVVSSDDTIKTALPCTVPNLTVVHQHSSGLPAARNEGIKKSVGDIVVFIDDDAIATKHWVENLLKYYSNDSIAGVGGRIIEQCNSNVISQQSFFPTLVGKFLPCGIVVGNFHKVIEKGSIEVDCLRGTNMSFRKDFLLQIGGFDVRFQGNAFREEADVCLRLRKQQLKIVYASDALVYHFPQSGGCRLPKVRDQIKSLFKNHTYFYLKNVFPEKKHLFVFFLGLQFLEALRFFFQKRDILSFFSAINGLNDAFGELGST